MGSNLELDEIEIAVFPIDVTYFLLDDLWISVKVLSFSNCMRKVILCVGLFVSTRFE